MGADQVADLKRRDAHRNAQRLGLVRASDHDAVVVAEHNDRLPVELGVKDPLAGDVEVIAVHEGEDRRHGLALQFSEFHPYVSTMRSHGRRIFLTTAWVVFRSSEIPFELSAYRPGARICASIMIFSPL